MKKNIGLFIALTGCRLNAADAIYIGLADAFIDNEFKDLFISNLKKTNWKSVDANHQILRLIKDLSLNSCGWEPYSKLRKYRDLISDIVNQPSLDAIIAAIEAVDTNDPWLLDAKQRILISSPLSQLITYNFFNDSKKLSLKEVLQCEIELSTKIVWEGDFFEGVRSLLIKKDGNPSWKHNNIQGIDLKTYYNNPAKQFLNWELP